MQAHLVAVYQLVRLQLVQVHLPLLSSLKIVYMPAPEQYHHLAYRDA
jgi:hypothetical protein